MKVVKLFLFSCLLTVEMVESAQLRKNRFWDRGYVLQSDVTTKAAKASEMTIPDNPYELFELNEVDLKAMSAQEAQDLVSKKRKKLALKWHPDKHVGLATEQFAQEMIKAINQAYETILNALKGAYQVELELEEYRLMRAQEEQKYRDAEDARLNALRAQEELKEKLKKQEFEDLLQSFIKSGK